MNINASYGLPELYRQFGFRFFKKQASVVKTSIVHIISQYININSPDISCQKFLIGDPFYTI